MEPSSSFYAAAAGALPMLYIALAVNERSSRLVHDVVAVLVEDESVRPTIAIVARSLYLAVVALILLSGVAAAFFGLADPSAALRFDVGYTGFFVLVALAMGGGLLVIQSLVGPAAALLAASKQPLAQRRLLLGAAVTVPATVLYGAAGLVMALVN